MKSEIMDILHESRSNTDIVDHTGLELRGIRRTLI